MTETSFRNRPIEIRHETRLVYKPATPESIATNKCRSNTPNYLYYVFTIILLVFLEFLDAKMFLFMVFAACASSAFALSFDKLELSNLVTSRNLIFALGVLILGIAGYMYLGCACCSNGKHAAQKSSSSGKKLKKHSDRASTSDNKRNSSTSSLRRSPRKSKAVY